MADGKAINRTQARGSINLRMRHAQFICGGGASSKRKVRFPLRFCRLQKKTRLLTILFSLLETGRQQWFHQPHGIRLIRKTN
jgi:hypothetical protein